MIKIETIAELLAHGYTVNTWCPKCRRHGPDLDLKKYVELGRGHLKPTRLGVRHEQCRSALQFMIRGTKGYGK